MKPNWRPGRPRLAPLLSATAASQALLVVLTPTVVAIGRDLGVSVGVAGQARSVTAAVAVTSSVAVTPRVDSIGVSRLLTTGSLLAVASCALVATASSAPVFLAAHVVTGLACAALLTAGFAGVAGFESADRTKMMGYVTAANAAAWIVVTPLAGTLTDRWSWRAAEAVPALIATAALITSKSAARHDVSLVPPAPGALVGRGSPRRWLASELLAYTAWTAFLTFNGAFLIEAFGVGEATAGWLMAVGPAAYMITSTRTGQLTRTFSHRQLMAATATLLAVLLPVLLASHVLILTNVLLTCLIGLAAGIRTPVSGALGLAQLPAHPTVMMSTRTAVTQFGYLLGATLGGALIDWAGYWALGLALALVMVASAALALGVQDPDQAKNHVSQPGRAGPGGGPPRQIRP
ncbi:MFS transporter [Streptomyces sp. 1222.5]|uniref:MFS transporter n=1 Tax=Streptomyces sp. 1222.5 TaxID=1881026 RepID=UPI003EB979CB